MKYTQAGRSRSVFVAIGLTSAVLAYATAQGSGGAGASQAPPPGRSDRAAEAEAAIARANPAPKLEAALGEAYGGVWFEASTAQMHVGVTSPTGRREAEAAVTDIGIAEHVTETTVSSSWAELLAAQDRWNHRLADLLRREEATTSVGVEANSVEIELGAAVPPVRRAALRRLAAGDDVDVSVAVARVSRLGVEPQARCSAFVKDTARCETPIVSGVTIDSEKVGGKTIVCTAGPPAVRRIPSTDKERTQVFILTAGHCIENGGGTGKWWSAYKQEAKEEPPLIGKALYAIHPKTDIGVIEVGNPGHWTSDGSIPLTPTVALWDAKETEPTDITGETEPMEGAEVCISGQSSGVSCGEIDELSVTSGKTEDLVSVKGAVTLDGDSGAPWYVKSSPEIMVGVHKGLREGSQLPVFHSLKVAFEKLNQQKGIDLELLTKGDEMRHPSVAAEEYPVTISAQDAPSEDEFTSFETSVKCAETEYHGEVTDVATSIELTPESQGCTVGVLPVTVTDNGCRYELALSEKIAEGQYSADMNVVCPPEQPGIQSHVYVGGGHEILVCTVTVPPQTGLGTVTLENSEGHIVVEEGTTEGVVAKKQGPCGTSETSSGVYHLSEAITVEGSIEEEAVDIEIGGE